MNTIDVRFKGRKTSPDVLYMGVQMDNNVEAAHFVLPPELDGATVELHLRYEDQADTIILKDDRTWVLTRKHTQYPGLWTGWIKATRASDDMTWHADPFSIQINSTPDPDGEEIPEKYPSAVADALKAAAAIINADVSAQTLPAGSEATADMTQDAEGNITIVYGIPQGRRGDPGYTPQKGIDYVDGASAYEIAKQNGFEGTETEWLESLQGKNGYTPIKNKDYFDGKDGKSAYEIALQNGFEGTEEEWLESLEGDSPVAGVDYYGKAETEALINEKLSDIPTPDVSGQISTHNTAKDAHSDIRALVDGKQPKGDYALKSEIPDVSVQVNAHNTATDAHGDLRLTLADLAIRLNALANSDDTTLDQMAEVVAYIKDNRGLIEQVTTNKVNVTDIVDNLTTNVVNAPLSAAQGVTLKGLIDALNTALGGKQPAGDYATREELPKVPTNVSAFVNDAKYLTPASTEALINEKLAQIPTPDVSGQIQTHNTATDAHSDIRALLAGKQPAGNYALKTELPTVPTNVSAFQNDANYVARSAVETMIQDAIKAIAPQKINFSQGKLYAPATSASYSATSVSDNSITFAYRGGSGVEELMYPITGLYKGRTYTIVFDETYNGSFIQDTYRYGCGVLQESEFASGTWPSNKSIPTWVVWHTGAKGTQSGSVTFTAQSSMVYWAWSLGRLSDGANVSITFNARVI